MSIEQLHRDIDKNWAKHLDITRKVLRVPSVSSSGEGIQDTADTMERMLRELGAKTSQFRASKKSHPLVYGHLDVGAKKTGAMYGMYDVQPIGDPNAWDYPAFGATIVNKKPYGEILVNRGVYNSKASLVGTLLAVKTMLDRDEMPINLHFLLEGEEESGGPSLPTFVRKNKSRMADADAGFWFDYSEDSKGEVDLSLGFKGCVTFDLISEGKKRGGPGDGPVHSSVAVILESPVHRLIKAISTLVDDNQDPAVDGMWDEVEKPSKQDMKLVKDLSKRFDGEEYLRECGAKRFKVKGSNEDIITKYCFEPSLNVAGMITGYTGEGYSTILPDKALAKIDIRLVPNMTMKGTRKLVRQHLDRRGYKDIEITKYEDYPWSKVSFKEDITQACIEGLRYHGKEPKVWPISAGSAPMYIFDQILGIPHGGTGLGFGGRAHAPNEFAVVSKMKDFEKSAITVMHKYAEISARKDEK
jgi:acetylornithine deacetylase/succinyl-diaminopimelate desuccinylase-like protein